MELVGRSGWGARAPKQPPVRIAEPVGHLFLHHSASSDGGPETIRAIQRFHQETRQWTDIAYTVLYSPRHRTFFEGRGVGIAGAHTRGYNRTSHALCVLGNYELEPVPVHVIEDLATFARWHHAAGHGPATYTAHRAAAGAATACPGKNLVALIETVNGLAGLEQPDPADPEPDDPDDDETDPFGRRHDVDWSAWERYLERQS